MIQLRLHLGFTESVGGVVTFAANISRYDGETMALADTSSAGVGAVASEATWPCLRKEMVDTGWIEK